MEEDEKKGNLDVRSKAAICGAFPYYIYQIVENCFSKKEIITNLKVTYEGINEVKNNLKKRLIRKYEYFFCL